MAERLVWFLLVDQKGAAYKGTTASSVSIPSNYVIDQFRDAVIAKNPRKLSHCDASDLLVYADKTAFDANTADVPTNLQPEDGIGQYGASDAKMYVVVPEESAAKKITWSAEELSTVDPQVQLNLWKSVVRITVSISSEVVCSATALVVDRTPSQLYLLTNLHLWSDELFDDDLSDEFKQEIIRYSKSHRAKKASGKRKLGADDVSEPPPRRSRKKASAQPLKPQVVIEQLFPDGKQLVEVHKFSLASDICWRSSADFDFAIFEVAVPQDTQLDRCEMSTEVYPTMHVHVFGFPGILKDAQFGHPYAIIPAEINGWHWNQMTLSTLSAPGLSGSAIVCTKRGIPVGYIGGGFDGSAKNEQYQSYGFTLHGIPQDLPSVLSA